MLRHFTWLYNRTPPHFFYYLRFVYLLFVLRAAPWKQDKIIRRCIYLPTCPTTNSTRNCPQRERQRCKEEARRHRGEQRGKETARRRRGGCRGSVWRLNCEPYTDLAHKNHLSHHPNSFSSDHFYTYTHTHTHIHIYIYIYNISYTYTCTCIPSSKCPFSSVSPIILQMRFLPKL